MRHTSFVCAIENVRATNLIKVNVHMCAQLHRHMWNARAHTHIEFCGRSYELRIMVLHTQFETLAHQYIENTHILLEWFGIKITWQWHDHCFLVQFGCGSVHLIQLSVNAYASECNALMNECVCVCVRGFWIVQLKSNGIFTWESRAIAVLLLIWAVLKFSKSLRKKTPHKSNSQQRQREIYIQIVKYKARL